MGKENGRRNGKKEVPAPARTEAGSLPVVGGRPRIFQSPEEFEEKVDEYVAACRENDKPLTMSGLVLALGFSSRQSLHVYEKRPEFLDAVTRARLLVENSYEERLYGPASAGAQFALPNINRKDWAHRRELSGPGGGPLPIVAFVAQLPDDVIRRVNEMPEEERREEIRRLAERAAGERMLGSGEAG